MIRKYPYKMIFLIIIIMCVLYIISTQVVGYLINTGYTNSNSAILTLESDENYYIPASNWQIYKYISDNSSSKEQIVDTYQYLNGTGREDSGWFPKNNGGLDFTIAGMNTRKKFTDSVKLWTKELGIDYDLVMACVLGEQIRISNKGARGNLKNLVINSTPKLLRSYNVSLGIGGIKVTTANQIKTEGCKYWYADQNSNRDGICNDVITSEKLADDDAFNAKYATYLVFNIIEKWKRAGYDISNNPGAVCTLYNIGTEKKVPNASPQIGGSIIKIGDRDYVYGGISLGVYWYLKIYSEKI